MSNSEELRIGEAFIKSVRAREAIETVKNATPAQLKTNAKVVKLLEALKYYKETRLLGNMQNSITSSYKGADVASKALKEFNGEE